MNDSVIMFDLSVKLRFTTVNKKSFFYFFKIDNQ